MLTMELGVVSENQAQKKIQAGPTRLENLFVLFSTKNECEAQARLEPGPKNRPNNTHGTVVSTNFQLEVNRLFFAQPGLKMLNAQV